MEGRAPSSIAVSVGTLTVEMQRSIATNEWPATGRFGPEGLEIGGCLAADLAERWGTPLLVVDEADLRARCARTVSAFPRAAFAVKAFPARAIIRVAIDEGLDLLVASDGELDACLRAGADPSNVMLHGNNKSDGELDIAVGSGIGLVSIDDVAEVDRLAAVASARGRCQDVLLRATPDVVGGTHSFIETGELDSKFGIPIEGGAALDAVRRILAAPTLRFRGLHLHVGSQITELGPYIQVVNVALDLAAATRDDLAVEIEILDVGGGFGATYVGEQELDPECVGRVLAQELADGASRRGLPTPTLMVEPGRALVAGAVVTLYRVGTVKRIPGVRTYVAVDGGMSDNIRPALYGAQYSVASAGRSSTAAAATVTVVGRHCESGDVVAKDVELPGDLGRGDLLAVAATGAYGYAMASNYNRVGRPAVVAVSGGVATQILRRETLEDLSRLEADPA